MPFQDLNPIEQLWDVVEWEISCHYRPKSLRNVSITLVNLCHEELRVVLKAKMGPTQY